MPNVRPGTKSSGGVEVDVERGLVAKVVATGEIIPAIEAKVTANWFAGAEHGRVWGWLLEFWNRHGETATAEALHHAYPTYRLPPTPEPLSWYLDEVREQRKYYIVSDGLAEIVEEVDKGETDTAVSKMSALVADVSMEVTALRDEDLMPTWEGRMDEYDRMRENKGKLIGLPMGFEHLDLNLGGLQPEQLICLIGLAKAGKSVTVLRMAISCHDAGAKVLFVGFEMSNTEQAARHDAMVAGINHWSLLHGYLTDDEMDKLHDALEAREDSQPFILSSEADGHRVSDLAALVHRYSPDVLFVDGVYLMDDDHGRDKGSPQAITNITRDLKRLAQRTRIPIVMTTQALASKMTGKRVTTETIGWSSSFVQDADVTIAVESITVKQGDRDVIHATQKRVSVLAARSAPLCSVVIDWDWATGTFRELDVPDDSHGVRAEDIKPKRGKQKDADAVPAGMPPSMMRTLKYAEKRARLDEEAG